MFIQNKCIFALVFSDFTNHSGMDEEIKLKVSEDTLRRSSFRSKIFFRCHPPNKFTYLVSNVKIFNLKF